MPVTKKQLLRLFHLVSELKSNNYPNCSSVAMYMRRADLKDNQNLCCSTKTIFRDIHLDEDSMLHTKLITILPDDDEAAEEVCQKAWDEFQMAVIITLLAVMKEMDKPAPFSLKPLTEYDKMIMKKNFKSRVKVIPMPSPEEGFGDMQKQLQNEINEVKISVAAGDFSAEEAEAKIKELEKLMQMLQP